MLGYLFVRMWVLGCRNRVKKEMKFQCEDCYQFLALVDHYQSQYAIFRILRQMATKIKKHEVLETEIRIHNLLIIVMKFDFKIYNYFF
jgi:hypothetical protein